MLHKKFISILLCLFPLLGYGQSLFTSEEQEQCISALSSYLEIDSTYIQELSNSYKQAGLSFDSIAYNKNIDKTCSISRKGIEICKLNNPLKLLTLLSKNKELFYTHPSNNIYNEVELHNALILLYGKKYKGKAYIHKQIELWKHTYEHILDTELSKQQYHPLHYDVLLELIELYYELGDLPSTIKYKTAMCEYIANCEGNDSEAYKVVVRELNQLYRETDEFNK